MLLKFHLDHPKDILKYHDRVLRDGLSSKMKKVDTLIDRYNKDLNIKYKETFDKCNELRMTRDKLAHWQLMFKDNPNMNDNIRFIRLKQIGYFTKEEDFDLDELNNMCLSVPNLYKSLDSLLDEMKKDLHDDVPEA